MTYMNKKQAPIVTFYSFKGGVGRSMAVANVAWLLAQKYRKKVVVVDWDLEAPGLHRFFDVSQETIKKGLIDLLYDYKELLKEEHKTLPSKLFVLDDYLIRIEDRALRQGSVSILCAGRQDKEYGKRVNEFNWEDFYNTWHGFGFIDYLKTELSSNENIDVVLLDSRTGITDIGGICTLQLPDVVVLLFALNEQNLNGIETTIQGIHSKATIATERKTPPELILRPARVERYLEQDQKVHWEGQAAERLGKYLSRSDRENPLRFMKQKSIPYIGGYGFGETPLAVVKDPDSELGAAFDDLTKSVLMTSGIWSEEASAEIEPEKFHLFPAEPAPTKQRQTQTTTLERKKKKWTLMFFFASDNTLSPSSLPQIKAIKAAGFQVDTNVLVYFDPNERGAPTRVLQINKDQVQAIGSDFGALGIPILLSDYIRPDEIREQGPQSRAFADSLQPMNDELQADTALKHFLGFCGEAYPAERYMLFLVGHGLVVGRDAFLPDDNPDSAIGLRTLGKILTEFNDQIGDDGLELIGMHSCSMSAIEVAYELKGKAKYMLASQGLSFVGSWPYRQMLTKIYHDIGQGAVKVKELAKSLHSLCIKYSVDFMHAGYSSDMCLCSLEKGRIDKLTNPISELSKALQDGLTDPRCRDLILLSHWKSQSYWQETYTDLVDFCLCLTRLCKDPVIEPSEQVKFSLERREYDRKRLEIIRTCEAVIDKLKPETATKVNGPIVCVDYVGPDTQFSHGISIYFPWSEPREDKNDHVIQNYESYAFTDQWTAPHTWLQFLNRYFEKTRRPDRLTEERRYKEPSKYKELGYQTLIKNLRESFPTANAVGARDFFPTSTLEGKVTPPDSTGGACSCASMKNYSREFSMSPGAATVFDNTKWKTASAAGGAGSTVPEGGPSEPDDE